MLVTHGSQVIGIIHDITARRLAEETLERRVDERTAELAVANDALQLNEWRLQALLKFTEMTGAGLQEIAHFAMEEAVRLTRSQLGYLAFASADESVLTMYAWSKSAMAQCAIQEKPIVYPVVNTGLWGEAVRQRRPIITNDYAAPSPLKKGFPGGHCTIRRHMNIPVFDGDRIVAVAGVGNKEGEYDESDIRQLRLLMDGMWRLIRRQEPSASWPRTASTLRALSISAPPSFLGATSASNRRWLSGSRWRPAWFSPRSWSRWACSARGSRTRSTTLSPMSPTTWPCSNGVSSVWRPAGAARRGPAGSGTGRPRAGDPPR